MVYNGINSTIGYYRGRHDSANSIVAGALSGMLFKSTRGIRPMMISGGLVASAAGAWAVSHDPNVLIWVPANICLLDHQENAVLKLSYQTPPPLKPGPAHLLYCLDTWLNLLTTF